MVILGLGMSLKAKFIRLGLGTVRPWPCYRSALALAWALAESLP